VTHGFLRRGKLSNTTKRIAPDATAYSRLRRASALVAVGVMPLLIQRVAEVSQPTMQLDHCVIPAPFIPATSGRFRNIRSA
jgi:hypothetical protein